MHKYNKYFNSAKLLVTICIFIFIVNDINFNEVKKILKTANSAYLFAALIFMGLHLGLVAIRWREVIYICGKTAPVLSILSLTLVGQFFRSLLPLSLGSDIARAAFCQQIGLSKTMGLLSVVIDRILGLISLAVIAIIVLSISESTRSIILFWVVLLLSGLIAFTLLVGRINRFINFKIKSFALLFKSKIYSTSILNAMTYSIFANISIVLSMFFLAASINCEISLIQALVYFPIVLLMSLLPISFGGWGVRELVLIYVFSLLSLPEYQAVFISITFGLIVSFYGFVGGIVLYKLNAILASQ